MVLNGHPGLTEAVTDWSAPERIERTRSRSAKMEDDMPQVVLEDAFKQFTLDQDKVLPPDETVRRFREKLKRVQMDILKETVRIDNGRLGIPVYLSTCGRDASRIIGTRKQMGKGATSQQAEASAVMELAERFSFFSFAQTPS